MTGRFEINFAVCTDIYSQIRVLLNLNLDDGFYILFWQMDFYIRSGMCCFAFDRIRKTDLIAGFDFMPAVYLLTVDKYFDHVIVEAFLKIDMNG